MPASNPDAVLAALKTATATLQASQNTAGATIRAATIAATIAIIAALLTFFAALITAWVARRNTTATIRLQQKLKHAEFRQKWIDNLREQMSKFQAMAYKDPTIAYRDPQVADAMLRVVLQMNPKDDNYQRLMGLMYDVMKYGRAKQGGDDETGAGQSAIVTSANLPLNPLLDAHADFVDVCQKILKTEWEVTKKGIYSLEPEYPPKELDGVRTFLRIHKLRFGWGPLKDTKADTDSPMPEPAYRTPANHQ